MKTLLITCFVLLCLLCNAQVKTLAPGEDAPGISLVNVDGKIASFNDYTNAKGFIVVFTCNTCPYAKAYEQRIIELDKKYKPLGFPVIAVNPNDAASSPGDSFENMKERARSANYSFPYLYDEGQRVTSLYGPKNTPHIFVISKTNKGNVIEYTGAIDNDTQNIEPGKTKYVEDAITALLNNAKPAIAVTKAIGCRISWKKS